MSDPDHGKQTDAGAREQQQATVTVEAISGRDREFLPAALEILETPPAPKSVAFMLALCAFTALAIAWSFYGRLDIHAVAWGKIEAEGRSKVIQPLEPGKILTLMVENGRQVRAGDVLMEMDATEARADEIIAREALTSMRAEIARRKSSIALATNIRHRLADVDARKAPAWELVYLDKLPQIAFPPSVPEVIRAREEAVHSADLVQLSENLKNLGRQMAQRAAARERFEMAIQVQNELIRTLEERVGVRSTTYKLGAGTSINLFDAQESLFKAKTQRTSDQGSLAETNAGLDELHSQRLKITAQFIADNETRMAETDRRAEDTVQQLAKAQARLVRTKLVSLIDGVVQQLAVTTVGQVVLTGQQLMVVTPVGGPLQIDAFVSNVDIGFIRLGQDAEVKIDAFPFTRFGTLKARVIKIAPEAIDEQEAKRQQANPLASANAASNNASVSPGQLQNFVFPVTLALDSTTMRVASVDVPLVPGMTVSTEIKTDSRRIVDYLLSPLTRIGSEAMRER